MDVREIPLALYKEFSEKYGLEGEQTTEIKHEPGSFKMGFGKGPVSYCLCRLDPAKTGFVSAIGCKYYETAIGRITEFMFWPFIPWKKSESWWFIDVEPMIRIRAGWHIAGKRSDKGRWLKETVKAEFIGVSYPGYDLKHPAIPVVAEMLRQAWQLSLKEKSREEWEFVIFPANAEIIRASGLT